MTGGTTYEVYLTISNGVSNYFNFTTTELYGFFDYDFDFVNYPGTRPSDHWEPTESARERFRSYLENFSNILCGTGFQSKEGSQVHLLIGNSTSVEGWGGVTVGDKIFLNKTFDAVDIVHEMRHLLGWTTGIGGSLLGYYTGDENWEKVMSFFSMNNNQSRVYRFYSENSALNLDMLYDYFMLCAINGQEVAIFYADDQG